jgi:hypothetical protein
MLVELAAANAAFAVIKETIANGGDIISAGQHLFTYFDNKAAIARKAVEGGMKSDMEEFMALERLKQQEEQLREMMIYAGRPGMWEEWIKFQIEAKKKREAAARAEEAKRQQFIEQVKTAGLWTAVVVSVCALGALIASTIAIWKGRL